MWEGSVKKFLRTWAINIAETYDFLSLRSRLLRIAVAPAAVASSLQLSLQLYRLDRRVASEGFTDALVTILHRYYRPSRGDTVPEAAATGPLLVLCNHPGLGDFPALLERLQRRDVRVIVKERELMADKQRIMESCIVITDSMSSKAAALQEGLRHLAQGGTLVVFPAGEIEDDPGSPAVSPGDFRLKPWMPVADSIARRCVRDSIPLTVLPAAVDSVYHIPRCLRSFVSRGDTPAVRSGRAAIITMAMPRIRSKQIRVRLLPPLSVAEDFAQEPNRARGLTEDIRQQIEELLG